MTTLRQVDVARLAEAWAHLPEGAVGTPLLHVPMTPAALLWLMERTGMETIEADLTPARPAVTVDDLMPGTGSDTGDGAIDRPRPAVVVWEAST